jgi:predicted membrane protein (TIGR00267 family)
LTAVDDDQAETIVYEEHVGSTRPYWRDIILGLNDGLVSVFLLVAGVVGGGLSRSDVLITGIAGALAGALSMAAGEYLATKSQEQVLDSELALETTHIAHFRQSEVDQLYDYFREMGVAEEDLETVVAACSRDDQTLLKAMKVLEFGVVDEERRSPVRAMLMSGFLFLLGAIPPVAPFFADVTAGQALVWSAVLSTIGLFAVGVMKTRVTRTNPVVSGLENLTIAALGGVAAWLIGRAVGTGLG